MRAARALGGGLLFTGLVAAGVWTAGAGTQAAAGPLQAQAEALVSARDEWGLMAYSMDRKQVLFAINAERLRVPASNNKVYSGIWALELLGAGHRFATDLLVAGEVQGGVLRGDVYLRGSGDPAFGHPEYDREPLGSVRGMARALQRMGVTRVEGSIVADVSGHTGPNFGPAWPRDTGNGASRYAPTVSALPYQENVVWVQVKDGVASADTSQADKCWLPRLGLTAE